MLEPSRIRQLLIAGDPRASELLRRSLHALPPRDRDAWLDALLGVDACIPDEPSLPRGSVPYYPCAADVIMRAVDAAQIAARDVFVDIGSGVGRVAVLTHLLTEARTVGLEIQPALVQRARTIARTIRVPSCEFIAGDAAELVAQVPEATVFFLYCPFSGARLERVLDHIGEIAARHPVRLCCVHLPLIRRPWLELVSPEQDELLIYRSAPMI